jgi:arabinofuranosyltransferase
VAAEAPGLRRRDGRAVALRRLAFAAGPPAASQLVLEGLRLAAFGHLLPNSVVYKTATGLTLEVLAKFTLLAAPVAALALVGAWRAPGRLRLLAVPPAVYVLGSLAIFDSANHFSRFFLPTWPEWALLAGIALAAMRAGVGARAGAAVIGGVVLTMLLVVPGNAWWVRRWSERYATCLEGARERAARWLSAHTPPRAAFSISDAGLVPAKAGGRAAIDDFLLNEPVIQRTGPLHVRQRVPMILGRRPDLVVLLSDRADRFHGPYAIDRGLAHDPRMRAYRLAAVARGGGTGCRYDLFIHERREMPRRRSR